MILVDIYVPSIDRTYDFDLDEYARISELVDEICEMITQTLQGEAKVDSEKMMLCSYDTKSVLPSDSTLYQCRVKTGSHLFIV
jgi:hypothetical protein